MAKKADPKPQDKSAQETRRPPPAEHGPPINAATSAALAAVDALAAAVTTIGEEFLKTVHPSDRPRYRVALYPRPTEPSPAPYNFAGRVTVETKRLTDLLVEIRRVGVVF